MNNYKLKIKLQDKFEILVESKTSDIVAKEFEHYMAYVALGNQNLQSISQTFKMGACEYYKCSENIPTEASDEVNISVQSAEYKEDFPKEKDSEEQDTVEDTQAVSFQEDESAKNKLADVNVNENILSNQAFTDGEVLDEDIYKKTKDNELSQILCDDYGFLDSSHKNNTEIDKNITLKEYMENTIANAPIDEFIVAACYLSEINDIKRFTLKLLNSKLYPATHTLINHSVIEQAKSRVLVESISDDNGVEYYITDNAWNVYKYDLKRP